MKPGIRDEAPLYTLIDRATHADGAEVVEIQMSDMPARMRVVELRH